MGDPQEYFLPENDLRENGRWSISDLCRPIIRNIPIVLIGSLLGLALGYFAQRTMTPVYLAKGNFVIDELPFIQAGQTIDAETERELVQTLILSIPSRDMVSAVEKRAGAASKKVAFVALDRPAPLRGPVPAANISVEATRNSRIGVVEAKSQDPEFAAKVVNAVLQELLRYNQIGGRLKQNRSLLNLATSKADSLLKQLVEVSSQRIKLERENAELAEYIKRGYPLDGFPSFSLDGTLNNLKTQLILVQSQFDSIASSSTRGARLEGKRAELQGLKRQVNDYAKTLAEALVAQFEISRAQESKLQTELTQTQEQIQELEQANTRLVQSFSDVALLPDPSLAQSSGGALQANVIAVIDYATTSNKPVHPKLWLNLLLGLIFGSAIGAAIAALRVVLDNRVDSADQIERLTGLPCLAMLPKQVKLAEGQRHRQVFDHPGYPVGLGFLRSYFLRLRETPEQRVIGFAPAKRGQDISSLVSDLAVLLAQAEKRTLIVDLHLSKPRHATWLGIQPQKGISDWLSADGSLNNFVAFSAVRELAVLDRGTSKQDLGDLLSRRPLSEALQSLVSEWDYILIDAPCILNNWDLTLTLPAHCQLVVAGSYKQIRIADILQTQRHARGPEWSIAGVVLLNCPNRTIR